jgi:hypothetical protein
MLPSELQSCPIINQSTSLGDPRDVTKEEMDAKFARVVIESFHTVAYLLSK